VRNRIGLFEGESRSAEEGYEDVYMKKSCGRHGGVEGGQENFHRVG